MKVEILEKNAIQQLEIIKVQEDSSFVCTDDIAVEEPLEIRVFYGSKDEEISKNISVTMRTPGNDEELAVGFLFTEGIISSLRDIQKVKANESNCTRSKNNTVTIELADDFIPELMKTDRNFYTTSSCGVCGKGSIEAIRTVSAFKNLKGEQHQVSLDVIYQLSEKLRSFQNNFSSTGGIHASGIFDWSGNLLALREDVGRHNALDKLIGHSLLTKQLPLDDKILLLSGRASFELIQKAAMAGISLVAAIGAPSSLAVDLAKEFDITLLGFLRDNRFNIYHSGENFKIEMNYENKN